MKVVHCDPRTSKQVAEMESLQEGGQLVQIYEVIMAQKKKQTTSREDTSMNVQPLYLRP